MVAAESQPKRTKEISDSPEKLLIGKKAIVTGGSRDVGKGIVEALAKAGVISAFSYRNKEKRAEAVLANVEEIGGKAFGIAADFSTPDGRETFYKSSIETLGDNIDFLILSSSGPTDELNSITSNDLLDKVLPHMSEDGVVIRLNSVPGHFMPQLEGSFSLGKYNDVAKAKHPDVKSLRARIPEMSERGVRFIEVCPAIVSGTNNINFAKRINPMAEELHYVVSDRLGVPRTVSIEQVGEKVVELLGNPSIKTGHTEFFNNAIDVLTPLEQWYAPGQVYVHTLEITTQSNDGTVKAGIGRGIISLEQTERANDPKMIDRLIDTPDGKVGVLTVKSDHAKGHFDGVLPRILPGHKQIRAAVEIIGMINPDLAENARLVSFESAEFLSPVLANGQTDLYVKPIKNNDGTYDVEISRANNGEKTAVIKGLEVRKSIGQSSTLLEDQIIEGAAQAAGVIGLENLDGSAMPILKSIGRVYFDDYSIRAGEGIEFKIAAKTVGQKGIEGITLISSERKFVGSVSRIKASLVSPRVINRLLNARS